MKKAVLLSIYLTTAGIFLLLIPLSSFSDESNVFYIRSDFKTLNGEIVESNLTMTPAQEEFRIKKFKLYKVSGFSHTNSKPDIISAAKHRALTNLLLAEGVKSVKSKSVSENSEQHDESVLSYEGFVKTPYKILNQGFDDSINGYHIEIEVLFSPVAYPPEWSIYYFKKKLYNTLHNMLSLFL